MTAATQRSSSGPVPLRPLPNRRPEKGSKVVVDGRVFWSEGPRVIDWIEASCIFTEGEWAGQPFRMMSWQKRLIVELFELEWRAIRGAWRWVRRFRRALIGLPRKSGKSEMAAAIALYLVYGDGEPTAKVYIAAAAEDQAEVTYAKVKTMCGFQGDDWEAPLEGEFLIEQRRVTLIADPNCYIERLTSRGSTKHGLTPHGVILDELHAWLRGEKDELWAALTTGSMSRTQPLQIAITTAGMDLDDSRCGDLYKLGRRIERGEVEAGGFFFRWWQAPELQCVICKEYLFDTQVCPHHQAQRVEKTDYRDPEMWRMASPSYGETVSDGAYADELSSTTESIFRRLYLNQWVDFAEAPWLGPGMWQACEVTGIKPRAGEVSYTGVDLSESRDSTAVLLGQPWEGEDRPCGHTSATHGPYCIGMWARIWEPPVDDFGRDVPDYEIPQDEVKGHIREKNGEYSVLSNVFDPWHSKLIRQDLAAEGMVVEEIWQTGQRRSGATAMLYDLIRQGRLHHDGDPVLARHVSNAGVKPVSSGGYYLGKRKNGKPMDGAMAMVNVVYGLTWAKAPEKKKAPHAWEDDD